MLDEGPSPRWRARARGRVNQILSGTCHITVKVEKLEDVAPATEGKGAGERSRSRRAGGAAAAGAEAEAVAAEERGDCLIFQ